MSVDIIDLESSIRKQMTKMYKAYLKDHKETRVTDTIRKFRDWVHKFLLDRGMFIDYGNKFIYEYDIMVHGA